MITINKKEQAALAAAVKAYSPRNFWKTERGKDLLAWALDNAATLPDSVAYGMLKDQGLVPDGITEKAFKSAVCRERIALRDERE